jgi:DNA-binding response OmpR family regulator
VKKPDVAILDVNLGDDTSLPIADLLLSLGVPFIFATGYGEGDTIPPRFSAIHVVEKPYDSAAILEKVRAVLQDD